MRVEFNQGFLARSYPCICYCAWNTIDVNLEEQIPLTCGRLWPTTDRSIRISDWKVHWSPWRGVWVVLIKYNKTLMFDVSLDTFLIYLQQKIKKVICILNYVHFLDTLYMDFHWTKFPFMHLYLVDHRVHISRKDNWSSYTSSSACVSSKLTQDASEAPFSRLFDA